MNMTLKYHSNEICNEIKHLSVHDTNSPNFLN